MSKLKELFSNHRDDIIKFMKYVLTGGSAFVVEQGLFLLLTRHFGVEPLHAHIATYSLMFWFVFLLNKFFTFKARNGFLKQLLKYAALYAFNLTVTSLLLNLLIGLGLPDFLAKPLLSCLIVLWNFPIYRFFIYK